MATDYLRYCSLLISNAGGGAIDLSELRVVFSVHDRTVQSPRSLVARVYNLSNTTINGIVSQASTPGGIGGIAYASGLVATLTAGYQDHYGIIFSGQIYQVRTGKESNVDTYFDIFAADMGSTYQYAVIAQTLGKGHTQLDVWKACAQVSQASTPDPPAMVQGGAPRSKVCFGLTRETLRDHATTNKIDWQYRNGALQGLSQAAIGPNQAIVLNSSTGMVGVPEQTQNGIMITSLLNAQYQASGLVKLNESDVAQSLLSRNGLTNPTDASTQSQTGFYAPTNLDGLYKILMVAHEGDTRGNPWYSLLTCISADPSAALPISSVNAIPDSPPNYDVAGSGVSGGL